MMQNGLRELLLEFLDELKSKAHDEFDEWDVKNGHPSFLVGKIQDINYFIHELNAPKHKYRTLQHPHDPKKIKWLATNSLGEVVGYTIKPRVYDDKYWVTGRVFTSFHQRHIKPYDGDWKDSLEKVKYDK